MFSLLPVCTQGINLLLKLFQHVFNVEFCEYSYMYLLVPKCSYNYNVVQVMSIIQLVRFICKAKNLAHLYHLDLFLLMLLSFH